LAGEEVIDNLWERKTEAAPGKKKKRGTKSGMRGELTFFPAGKGMANRRKRSRRIVQPKRGNRDSYKEEKGDVGKLGRGKGLIPI